MNADNYSPHTHKWAYKHKHTVCMLRYECVRQDHREKNARKQNECENLRGAGVK